MKLNMNVGDVIQTAMAVITAAGILVAVNANRNQLQTFNDQLKLNFFADYTKRYQEIVLNLPDDINEPGFNLAKMDREARNRALKQMRAYFDLCSEEYHLQQTGRIDPAIWAIWAAGIKYTLNKDAFREAWFIISRETRYDPVFQRWADAQIEPRSPASPPTAVATSTK